MLRSSHKTEPRRAGAITLEFILVAPLLIIMLLAFFHFGTALTLQPAVTHAATKAAREAGKGANVVELAEVVQNILAANCITISDAAGSGTKIVLEEGPEGGNPSTVTEYGDPLLTCSTPANALGPGEFRVTVCIDVLGTTGVCDLLNTFGVSWAGKRFEVSSLVREEIPRDNP